MTTSWRSRAASRDQRDRLGVDRDRDASRPQRRPPARRPRRAPGRRGRSARARARRRRNPSGRARGGRRRGRSAGRSRPRCRRGHHRPAATGSSRWRRRSVDAAPHDREGRPQLVAGVGGELALAAHRVADRDQRPVGVDATRRASEPPMATRPPSDEHDQQDGERPLLVGRSPRPGRRTCPAAPSNGSGQDAPRRVRRPSARR